jgi:hypothetical protein
MNFFQIQNKLFYSKKDDAGFLDQEGEAAFVPFLINRWLSFYNKDTPNFVNETLNKYTGLFEDKQQLFRLYYNILPRFKYKKITYIKKVKKNKEEDVDLAVIAKNNNISVRELKQYVDLYSN